MANSGFRRILIATDGTDSADAALDVAASVALMSEQPLLRVVHVWRLELHHRHGTGDMQLRRNAEALLDRAVGRLNAAGAGADRELARSDPGHVAPAVAEAARRFQADLVIVGSRGLTGWQALLHHSVSHSLMGSLDCPLMIVRAQSGSAPDKPKRVMLAVGADNDVGPAVRAAAAAASHRAGSKVLVVHVVLAGETAQRIAFVESAEHAQKTIDDAVSMLREAGVESEGWVLRPGYIAVAVADAAARWEADIVVMGPARSGALVGFVFESVTHALLRETETPLLIAEKSPV